MAQSPPRAKMSPYSVLNDGLDHALQLLENVEDLPTGLKLRPGGREKKTPCAMWKKINVLAKARWHHCIRQERRRKKREQAATAEKSRAKEKEKEKEKNKSTTPRNGERKKDEPLTISVTKTNNKQLQTEQESKTSRRKSRNEPPTPPTPNVKMLDLSGSNLSPMITHTRPTRKQQTAMDGLKPLAPTIADPNADLLTKLQRLPMLEDVVAGSEKLKLLKQWLAKDDGKNENLSLSLKELILELQKNQHLFNPINDNDTPSSSPRDLDETLDERMKKEKAHKKEERQEKLRRIKAKEKVALKPSTQSPREKLCTVKAEKELKSRKRPLVVFVVDSDEEEYEEEGESESEEEYEGDDDEEESEDDAGVEFGDADDDDEDRREVRNDSKSLPASSPKSAKEQLAVVTAQIRKDESQQRSSSTYLSYGKTTSKPTETKSGASATRPSITPPTPRDGSSVSSAIVLEDSDDEDDDEETEIVVAAPSLPPPPPPTPPKVKKAERLRATPPTPPKPTKAATSNGKGKAKATPPAPSKKNTSGKRRANVDSDDESEAEFQGPDEDGSSTDAEPDLFDLNEQDVYVVETILEVKVGRSLLNNSGRRTKEADLFLVKWDGYEELTWEPEDNIPNRLIQFFHDREAAKRACQYQVEKFMHRKVSLNSTTGKREILYLILWKGQSQPYWEVKSNLPEKVVIWLEKTSRASLPKSPPANGPGPRKKAKN